MGESARGELERVTTLVTGLEAAGHAVADLDVAVSPESESTVTAQISLADAAALEGVTLRIDDAQLTGSTLELTATVAAADTIVASDTDCDADGDQPTRPTTAQSTADQTHTTDDGSTQTASHSDGDTTSSEQTVSGGPTATGTDNSASQTDTHAPAGEAESPAAAANDPTSSGSTTDTDEPVTDSTTSHESTPSETDRTPDETVGTDSATGRADADTARNTTTSPDESAAGESETADTTDTADCDTESTAGGPVHRDPDRLEAVYDPDATFAEMTDALGADVTPQTVRKYMIEYDIHEPSSRGIPDTAEHTEGDTATAAGDRTAPDEAGSATDTDGEGAVTGDGTDTSAGLPSLDDTSESGPVDQAATEDTAADSSEADAPSGQHEDEATATSGATPSGVESDDPLSIADIRDRGRPLALPDGVELDRLVDAVAGSRTVYEVRKQLGLDDRQTRTLLKRCGLIDLVTGRITRGSSSPDEQEVIRRIIDASDGTDSADASATTG